MSDQKTIIIDDSPAGRKLARIFCGEIVIVKVHDGDSVREYLVVPWNATWFPSNL